MKNKRTSPKPEANSSKEAEIPASVVSQVMSGLARRQLHTMTAAERTERARQAVKTRWAKAKKGKAKK